MPAFPPRLRALAVGTSAFALMALAAGGTLAAATNPPTLYACYDTYGNVRMSDVAQCKLTTGGRLVSWSTVPAPGPTGPTGQTGPTGPTGAQGAAGSGNTTELITITYPELSKVVHAGFFTVDVGCTATSPTQLFASWDLDSPPSTPVTYAAVHAVETPHFQTSNGAHTGASYDTTLYPGPTDLWVSAGGESFHATFAVDGVKGSGTCQVFVTH